MGAREHDVIVVGAGASGIVVASRLAERGVDVLLVEAGADWRSGGLHDRLRRPYHSFAWSVDSIPQDHLWEGMTARRYPGQAEYLYIRGRGVGGSTLVNGMIALRPPLSEFAHWRSAGGTSWTRAAVLDAFRRLESDHDHGDSPLHGADGPLPITRVSPVGWGTVDGLVAIAAQEAGHSWVGDVNGEGEDGIGSAPAAIVDGKRVSVADAYLDRPGAPAPEIMDRCTVQSLELVGGAVRGIRIERDGETRVLRANRVVLASGAVMTAALLQRSGVGSRALLADAGVEQLLDLPVGEGLQEHVGMKLALHLDADAHPAVNDNRGNVIVRYSSGHEGYGEGDLVMSATNVSARESSPPAELIIKLAQCHSRGRLAIRSGDPAALPEIDLGLLSDPRDRRLAHRAFSDLVAVTRSRAFAGRLAAVSTLSGEAVPDPADTTAVDGWLLAHATDTAHICGTAPLGRPGDGVSVVGDDARVHGVDNLWIADLSITPTVPRANTQLTAMMIGERVADILSPPRGRIGSAPVECGSQRGDRVFADGR